MARIGTLHFIYVTGHTDRIGSAKYNQKLSEQRANAVRDYLVSKDIPANRIVVEGKVEIRHASYKLGLGRVC